MAGYFKSEIDDAAFNRTNQHKIEAAVDAVATRYCDLRDRVGVKMDEAGYEAVEDECQVVQDMKTMLDAWKWLHANYHHFQKYHAAGADAWGDGGSYLGTQCVNCEYSRSQYRAIVDHLRVSNG